MPEPFTRLIPVGADLAEVGRVQRELAGLWEEFALPAELENPVSLALEEVLSNVLRHGGTAGVPLDVRVAFEAGAQGFAFEVSDSAAPYNPLDHADPDLTLPLAQRRPGGLGVFIVKKLADELRYQRRDGRNHLRFFKRFPPAAPA